MASTKTEKTLTEGYQPRDSLGHQPVVIIKKGYQPLGTGRPTGVNPPVGGSNVKPGK
jgi:hypothetical protein